ncbi:HAD-IA family hydrolase [Cryobacterium sp. GrIS_2_6]|uniref:HAD-IA family hydrolase n=1 Tax=Cryobacterium sp. GrIS_2_6 TaxID=3162785 RepID=UPI002E00C11C|nr:HAD-IA family hydrolase [Cryobacterium psychrotolerans]MEC5152607.1 sugar-phosphatase [Cryobacterium psychrotolerans]
MTNLTADPTKPHTPRTSPDKENTLLGRVFEAVLFDNDGTLVDSTNAVNRSWLSWAKEAGLGTSFRGASHGVPARQMLATLIPADQIDDAVIRLTQIELADTMGIRVLPGAGPLLASIPEHRRAIVSSATRELCLVRLAAAGVPTPATIITIEDTGRGKPFPEPFLEAAARLGFDPARCLVVEDAPAGLEAARAAGCATIGVEGTHDAADLDADLVVTSLDRLRIVVQHNGVKFELLPE